MQGCGFESHILKKSTIKGLKDISFKLFLGSVVLPNYNDFVNA